MTTLKIKVTKDILEKSKNCNEMVGQNCAVALAVRDVFPAAHVLHHQIRPFSDDPYLIKQRILLPKEATLFIIDFDRAEPGQRPYLPEIEFEIQIPDEVIEKINIDSLRPLLQNHPTLELVEGE